GAGGKSFGASGEHVLHQHRSVWKAPRPQVRLDVLTFGVNDVKLLGAVSRLVGQHGKGAELHLFLAVVDSWNLQHSLCLDRLRLGTPHDIAGCGCAEDRRTNGCRDRTGRACGSETCRGGPHMLSTILIDVLGCM